MMTAHFLSLLDELQRRSLRMASAVEDMLLEACDTVTRVDKTLARRIIDRDADIDEEEVAIEAETLRLMTLFQPMGVDMRQLCTGVDMRQLCTILKVNSDLERIADCTVNIAERAYHLAPETMEEARAELKQICPVVRRMLHDAIHAYATADKEVAEKVRSQDDLIDAFYAQFIRKVLADTSERSDSMAALLDILSIAKNLERIADHATNIAEDVVYLATGHIIRHSNS
jgi:phosphate transport system protein